MFYDKVKQKDLGKRALVLKHLYSRTIMAPFERCFHEGSIYRGHISVMYFIFTKHYALHSLWGSVL